MKSSITRREIFHAAHKLYVNEWDEAKNLEVFGKCAHPNFHGHNYELHVSIIGEIDEKTGYVYDISHLKSLIKEYVLEPYDHKNLNLDVEEFKTINPTVENISKQIYDNLRPHVENRFYIKVKLYETERNYSEYPVG